MRARADKRYSVAVQEYTEAAAAVLAELNKLAEAAHAGVDAAEDAYNALYEGTLNPIVLAGKRELGAEMFGYCMQHAGELARLAA